MSIVKLLLILERVLQFLLMMSPRKGAERKDAECIPDLRDPDSQGHKD